jgi:hypothetical protein
MIHRSPVPRNARTVKAVVVCTYVLTHKLDTPYPFLCSKTDGSAAGAKAILNALVVQASRNRIVGLINMLEIASYGFTYPSGD